MAPITKFFLSLLGAVAALFIAASIPWTSRTAVDMQVVDEEGKPIPGAHVSFLSGTGGVLAEGVSNEKGVVVLQYSPNPDSDWGKHVWRFEFLVNDYATNETPVTMSEKREGSVWAWFAFIQHTQPKPHLLFLIKARVVCRKIS